MRKLIDLPKAWLAGMLLVAWWQGRYHPMGLSFGSVWADLLGGLLVGGGLLFIALAVAEMRWARTTVMPNEEASQLVTGSVFKLSRNPIYVGDAMILLGLILYWDAVPSLVLLPIFVWVVEKRFVEKEEKMLRRKFLAQYAKYAQQTRRWL